MTRDWNLIRKILIRMEQEPGRYELRASDWPYYDTVMVDYHLNLMFKAELIEGECLVSRSAVRSCRVKSITWKGHELLDTIRRDTVWIKIKQAAIDKGVDLTFDLIPKLFQAMV